MFKKFAHSPVLPSLTGNSELRPLQEVITTEKHVLQSIQKLSVDLTKSSEALREWAHIEGDDLRDTFSACSTLLNHWIMSLGSFASHIARIRECLKAVRTREEALEVMRNRRKSLISKADNTEKKVLKMDKNHKNLRQQTDFLLGLREHIRALETEIANEQTGVGDFKRVKAREWMGVFFGALQESSEKGVVVARSCRSIVGHVSIEKTQLNHARAQYTGRPQVRALVVNTERELQGILFTSEVGGTAEYQGSPIQYPQQQYPQQLPMRPLSAQTFVTPPLSGSPPAQFASPHPMRHYASFSFPDNNSRTPGAFDFGDGPTPLPRSNTYTPGQRNRYPASKQPQTNTVRSVPSSPRPDIVFVPGHESQPSQSSMSSAFVSTPGRSPPPPLSPLPYVRRTSSGPGYDELPELPEEHEVKVEETPMRDYGPRGGGEVRVN